MSAPKCLFFSRILSTLTEVFGRYIRANDPRMSAGYPSQKLPLWAAFSFLTMASVTYLIKITIGDESITYYVLEKIKSVKRQGYITIIISHTALREKL